MPPPAFTSRPHVRIPSRNSLIGSAKGPDFPYTSPIVILSFVPPGAAAPDAAVVAAPPAAVAAPPVVAALAADVAVVPVALVAELDDLLSLPQDAISSPATAGNASHPSAILPFAISGPPVACTVSSVTLRHSDVTAWLPRNVSHAAWRRLQLRPEEDLQRVIGGPQPH